ncbi:MAG: ATP-binding protein, partial [Actinomycetota bacterium]|nr:ATP-binding protein [Actinomycetota bacterium]
LDWIPVGAGNRGSLGERLQEHFAADPSTFPVTSITVPEYDRPNLQAGIDAYLSKPGRSAELLGLGVEHTYMEPSLAQLVGRGRAAAGMRVGPVGRTVVELDEGRSLACVTMGLFLVSEGDSRLAVLVTRQRYQSESPVLEVMAAERQVGEAFMAELRRLQAEHNVYRGKLISLSQSAGPMGGRIDVSFHRRRRVARNDIVLAEGVLERVERSTVEFDRQRESLRAAGRHLRRGILLHGPPGTGKTLTATYLAEALEGRTVLVLTGPALALIRASCTMARSLQPSMVVLEDIDLVAEERTQMGPGTTSLLFQLLNEIDGMGEDSDVIFVMTTNRADILEPALAARPGRVDQAVELALPDAAARARLIELFCEGLSVELRDPASLVEKTEGASPAFLRELVRKAKLAAAIEGHEAVRDEHFEGALGEMEEGGRLTRSILGAGGDGSPPPPAAEGYPAPRAGHG